MRNKIIFVLGILTTALALGLWTARKKLHTSQADIERLRANQQALMDTVYTLRVIDGLSAYEVETLELTKKEFSRTNTALKKEVERLKVKVKNLQSADRVGTKTEYVFVPDTVIITKDSLIEKTVQYKDKWIDFKMDQQGVKLTTNDTIYVIKHQKVKRFLFWVRRRDNYITIRNANPHTKVTQIQSITIDN